MQESPPAPAPASEPASWPQWRGPERDGSAPGPSWPADLGPERLIESWRVSDLGPSYSGPVADAERVYTTATVAAEREVVLAFDRATGEELWRQEWVGAMKVPFFAARNGSWIRSTPAIDGDSLFVAGMRDKLVCLDARSGELRWSVDFGERFGSDLPPFGCVSSPLVIDGALLIQAGGALLKLDKLDGETLWRSMEDKPGMMSEGAFSSPIVATLAGRPQVLAQSRDELAGVDLESGRLLWSTPIEAFRGMNILTPTVIGEAVFTSSYGGRSQLFAIEREPSDEGGESGLRANERWKSGVQGYMTTPVVVDGHAYLFGRNNRFVCLDLESGAERWTSPPTGDSYWSLALQGERILALSDTGVLRLLSASPSEYQVLSERVISEEETWAHLAPAGEQLFVRAQDSLIALRWK